MKILYKTKPNVNGNATYLLIDHANKIYRTNCSIWTSADVVLTTNKTTIRELKAVCIENGYNYIN